MRLSKLFFTSGLFAAFVTGCATSPQPKAGLLFSDFKGPNEASMGKDDGKKMGQSCASSVLGLVGWGDASIETARAKAQIQNIAAVDYKAFSVLGFVYMQTCTQVSGS
jgi:hypothetical protein